MQFSKHDLRPIMSRYKIFLRKWSIFVAQLQPQFFEFNNCLSCQPFIQGWRTLLVFGSMLSWCMGKVRPLLTNDTVPWYVCSLKLLVVSCLEWPPFSHISPLFFPITRCLSFHISGWVKKSKDSPGLRNKWSRWRWVNRPWWWLASHQWWIIAGHRGSRFWLWLGN